MKRRKTLTDKRGSVRDLTGHRSGRLVAMEPARDNVLAGRSPSCDSHKTVSCGWRGGRRKGTGLARASTFGIWR